MSRSTSRHSTSPAYAPHVDTETPTALAMAKSLEDLFAYMRTCMYFLRGRGPPNHLGSLLHVVTLR